MVWGVEEKSENELQENIIPKKKIN